MCIRDRAEVDIVASEEAVVVAFMDQRSSSVVGAVNAGTIRLAVLTEGNLTFDAPFAAGETGDVDQFDPTLAMLPDGRTWIGWFEDDGAGTRHVRVARAAGPSGPYTVAAPLDDGVEAVDRPWITVAPDGTVYAAWVGAPSHRAYLTRSTDGGATFEPAITSDVTGTMLGGLSATPDGSLWIVLNVYEGPALEDPLLVAARSRDGGAHFEPPLTLGHLGRPGRVIARSAPWGASGVLVAYTVRTGRDDVTSPDLVDGDIFLAGSSDGLTVVEGIAVPAPAGHKTVVAPPPAVAVDTAGDAHVLFYARRADGGGHDVDWRVFAATGPAGASPTTVVTLSPAAAPGLHILSVMPPAIDVPTWLGDTVGLAVVGTTVHAAFAENREGDADVFWSRF